MDSEDTLKFSALTGVRSMKPTTRYNRSHAASDSFSRRHVAFLQRGCGVCGGFGRLRLVPPHPKNSYQ
jgi:hypothetical protein